MPRPKASMPALLALGILFSVFALAACAGESPTQAPTAIPATAVPPPPLPTAIPATAVPPLSLPTATPAAAAVPSDHAEPISIEAASASITVDGGISDWSGITPTSVTLEQIEPIPGEKMGDLDPIDVDVRIATGEDRIYVLMEVPDDYDYNPEDHSLSPAVAVMLRIDDPAAPHMGTTEEDQETSLGKVDIWHWELDCGPSQLSGGVTGISGGNDPECNFDDEYSTTPEEREDDGSTQAENSLAGVWEHTARSQGAGAEGTWIFEMSRKLQTGDPDDAQLSSGGRAYLTLAYWDADETSEGWTGAGHLQSSEAGWIEIALP